jgi:hypothetical protein
MDWGWFAFEALTAGTGGAVQILDCDVGAFGSRNVMAIDSVEDREKLTRGAGAEFCSTCPETGAVELFVSAGGSSRNATETTLADVPGVAASPHQPYVPEPNKNKLPSTRLRPIRKA